MINRFATKNHRAEDVEDQIASSSKEKKNNKKAPRNGITIYLLVLAVAFVFAIGVASGFAIASSSAVTTTSSELFLQDEPAGGGKAAAVPAQKQKRPLQIFPLLKELNSGWKNMEVPPLVNKNATGTRALIVDVGLFSGKEFFGAIDNGFEVVGFEPSPESFPKLKKLCKRKARCNVVDLDTVSLPLQRQVGHSYLINAAAGNKQSIMSLMLKGMGSSLTKSAKMMTMKSLDVKMVRIDDIIREDIYLLKVDTQGFDQYVIEGASELFKHHVVRQVIVEVDPYNMGQNNHTVHGFLDTLQSNGMMCFSTRNDQPSKCQYFGESVEGFEGVFDGTPVRLKFWSECWDDFLCLNIEKSYHGEIPAML